MHVGVGPVTLEGKGVLDPGPVQPTWGSAAVKQLHGKAIHAARQCDPLCRQAALFALTTSTAPSWTGADKGWFVRS